MGATRFVALRDGKCAKWVGVEADAEAAAGAREVLTDVHEGDIEGPRAALPRQRFRYPVHPGRLSHFARPQATLAKLVRLLRRGGRLFLTAEGDPLPAWLAPGGHRQAPQARGPRLHRGAGGGRRKPARPFPAPALRPAGGLRKAALAAAPPDRPGKTEPDHCLAAHPPRQARNSGRNAAPFPLKPGGWQVRDNTTWPSPFRAQGRR